MAQTQIRGTQVEDGTIQRRDLNIATAGQAVVAKIVQGTNVTLSSTGADSGTGDVTVSVPTGGQGPAGLNAFNVTSGAFTVPPVGSTVTVTLTDASWVVVGQLVYVDQAGGGAGQAGALVVQSKTGNQLTLLNPTPAPAIPPADATQAGLLKQLSGSSLDYVGGDNACHSLAAINSFVSKTSAYTLTAADSSKYVICSGGSWTLTLPAPAAGLNYRVRNDMGISGTTGTITIATTGGTIDNLASISLLPQQEATIISDGTNWRSFGLKREVILGVQDLSSATASSTVLLPVGFRLFELDFTAMQASAPDVNLLMQLSSDGGTTWITTSYSWSSIYNSSATAVANSWVNGFTGGVIGAFPSIAQMGQSSVKLYPGLQYPLWLSDEGYYYSTPAYVQKTNRHGYCSGGTPPVNALKYYAGSGNITNIHLTVKGIV